MEKEGQLFNEYMSRSSSEVRQKMSGLTEEMISQATPAAVLKNFHFAAEKVPAYKKFLKENKINPEKIISLKDFESVPLTTKENYLSKYPLQELIVDGDFSKITSITSSSGSSGNPFYWPRSIEQDFGIVSANEAIYLDNFEIDKKTTLHLTALGMGVWTGGDGMSMSAKMFAQKGYPFVSINTGLDLKTNMTVLKDLGRYFDQVIITLYPSFATDIVNSAAEYGLDWKKLKLKFYFGGEPFAEEWRDYISEKIFAENKYKDVCSVFGSSEGGAAGVETSLCIYVRQECKKNPKLNIELFNDTRSPSIVQYNPLGKYFESVKGELVLTTVNGLPLIRYNTRDAGSVNSLSVFLQALKKAGLDPENDLKKAGCTINWQLPILYLFGRSDTTASIYGLNIYPENIRSGLSGRGIQELVSGRFFLETINKRAKQILQISVELQKGRKVTDNNTASVKKSLVAALRRNNSEYNKLCESVGAKADPVIILVKHGSDQFKTENKLKFVRK